MHQVSPILLKKQEMALRLLYIISLFIGITTCGDVIEQRVVEHVTTTVNIPCGIQGYIKNLFWKINDNLYEAFNLPNNFEAEGFRAIKIRNVTAELDGYLFQCISFSSDQESDDKKGEVTMLTVLTYHALGQIDEGDSTERCGEVHGNTIKLNYNDISFQNGFASIRIQNETAGYIPTMFSAEVYESDIEMCPSGSPNNTFSSSTRDIHISLYYLHKPNIFFRFVTERSEANCRTNSSTYYNIFHIGTEESIINKYGEVGEEIWLPIESAGEIVWSGDERRTRLCVCPTNVSIEDFKSCSQTPECNNTYSIQYDNGRVYFSNLTFAINNTLVYFQDTTRCERNDLFKTNVLRGYRLIVVKSRRVVIKNVVLNQSNGTTLCFGASSIRSRTIHSYSINLTDIAGNTEEYNNTLLNVSSSSISSCVRIHELFPNLCGALLLLVEVIDSTGSSSIVELNDTERSSCSCFEGVIKILETNSSSATLLMRCEEKYFKTLVLFIAEMKVPSTDQKYVMLRCGENHTVSSLHQDSSYNVIVDLGFNTDEDNCFVARFTTGKDVVSSKSSWRTNTIIAAAVLIVLTVISIPIAIAVLVITLHIMKRRKEYYPNKKQVQCNS